jgi:hypothetical protein
MAVLAVIVACAAIGADTAADQIEWRQDYHAALDEAARDRKMVLLWFYDPDKLAENAQLQAEVLLQPTIVTAIRERFVGFIAPTSLRIHSGGEELRLLDHSSLAEMQRRPGLAIIDMTDDGTLFRQVVSIYPFRRGPISPEKLKVLLDLPRGTLTQRSLIFAVRTHPEQPASTRGEFSELLSRETENHAWHQANIALQGHHNWESRFHAINARISGGLIAQEVCAESWPGQTLMDAAEECVHSWRQSPGHWQAVSSRHALFGYDMKRGANGVWYAAGIFAH